MALTDKLKAIGDAIREKTGGADELSLDQMVDEIEAISGGGGTELEDGLVTGTLTTYENSDVMKVGNRGFYGMKKLETVSLPNVTNVLEYAFAECPALTTVDLPELKGITSYAFYNASKLTTLNAPKLATIGSSAFYGCKALKKVELRDASGTISNNTFYGCTSLIALIIRHTEGFLPEKPSLQSVNAFTGGPIAEGTGYIYVEDDLVEAYKTAYQWKNLADQIKPISDYVEVTE